MSVHRPASALHPFAERSTPRMDRRAVLLGGLATMSAPWLLSACGGGSKNDPESRTAATGEAKPGGTLTVARPPASNAETLDPASSLSAYEYLGALYNRLVKQAEDGTLAPDLATEWETKDAKDWTITLRKGVTWHDGKPFTAKDAAYTLQHILDPDTQSPQAGVLAPFVDPQAITTPSDDVLKISLKSPNAEFMSLLVNYNCYVIPDGSAKTIGASGIGTGPFKLDSFEPAGKGAVTANPDYFDGRPVLDRIEFTAIANVSARVNALKAGQVDLVAQTNLDFATIKVVQNTAGITTATVKNAQMYTMPMLCTKAPFTDPDVRKAFKIAYDPDSVLELSIHGLGTAAHNNPVLPTDPYFLDYSLTPDPEQAKSLLDKAGFKGAIELFTSDYDPVLTPMSLAFKDSVKSAGIDVSIKNSPADSYYTEVWIQQPFCASYWYTGRPVDQLLNQIFRGGSSYNESMWDDGEFADVLDAARAEVDDEKRKTLYQDAQRLLIDNDGTILPFFADRTIGLSSKIVNYKEYGFEFDYMNIGFAA